MLQNRTNAGEQVPGTQQKEPVMASHDTKKNYTKSETIARRAQRAAKYANAAMMTRSGRSRRATTKAAW